MSVGGGIALPVLGSSGESAVEWTTLGNALSLRTAGGLGTTEKLSPEGKAFSSYFLNFGYSIDAYEVLLNYRNVSTTVDAPLDKTKGVGALCSAVKRYFQVVARPLVFRSVLDIVSKLLNFKGHW